MKYRNPDWTGRNLVGSTDPKRALPDWTQATTLGEEFLAPMPEISEAAECSCLDRSLADLLELIKALDAYHVDH